MSNQKLFATCAGVLMVLIWGSSLIFDIVDRNLTGLGWRVGVDILVSVVLIILGISVLRNNVRSFQPAIILILLNEPLNWSQALSFPAPVAYDQIAWYYILSAILPLTAVAFLILAGRTPAPAKKKAKR